MVYRKDTERIKVEQLQTTFRCIMNTPHESTERNSQFVLRTLQITAIDFVLLYTCNLSRFERIPVSHMRICIYSEPQNQNTIQ